MVNPSRDILFGVIFMIMTINPVTMDNYFATKFTEMEKSFINKTSYNCTATEIMFGLDYQVDDKTQPSALDISLILYSGNETEKIFFKLTDPASDLFNSSKFNANLPITVVIHGYYSDQRSGVIKQTTSALLKQGGTNVLTLYTGDLLKAFYGRAAINVIFIGELLGLRLVEYVNGGVDRTQIHLIGHSLGAHVAGYAGKTFYSSTGSKINRISGLDPAGPCFFSMEPGDKLCSTDADFVDVIHSDAGILGIIEPLGHVDFYPNNGENQPNALIAPQSHGRSWKMYVESITNPYNFPAVSCDSWEL